MKRAYFYVVLITCVIVIFGIGYFCFYGPVTTVILVRHAEKVILPPTDPHFNDPPLSADGMVRAQTLRHVVGNAGIDVIFATEFQRTQMTVAPTAANLGFTPVIIPKANIEELINTINADHRGEEILVAGHSDTVPRIMEGLGVSSPPVITENKYDNLFIVHIRHSIVYHVKLTHLKYGNPSP